MNLYQSACYKTVKTQCTKMFHIVKTLVANAVDIKYSIRNELILNNSESTDIN